MSEAGPSNPFKQQLWFYGNNNLTMQKDARDESRLFGSCANNGLYSSLPMGIDCRVTTSPPEDATEMIDSYIVHSKSIATGEGNHLVMRYVEKQPVELMSHGGHDDFSPPLPVLPLPNPDGTPVYAGYFEATHSGLKYGWLDEINWRRAHDPEKLRQFDEGAVTFKQEKATAVFLLDVKSQLDGFLTLLLDRYDWRKHIVWQSEPMHNRAHYESGNTLVILVLQFKE